MPAFILNEWLWADAGGDNGQAAQSQANDAIVALSKGVHQIIIIEGSAFDYKAWALCKKPGQITKLIATGYVLRIRQNSDCCMILKPDAIDPIPEKLVSKIKPDDQYLVQAQLAVPGAVIVTTDAPLMEILKAIGLPVLHRDDFFAQYIPQQ